MDFEMIFDDNDLEEIEELVTSDKFAQFLLNNTTQFVQAAFILQTLMDRIEEIKNTEDD